MKATFYVLLFSILCSFPAQSKTDDWKITEQLKEAEQAYRTGENEKAYEIYLSLLGSADLHKAPLLFNLASAALKTKRVGEAHAYLIEAQKLAPFDSDIQHNLNILYGQLKKKSNFGTTPTISLPSMPLEALLCITLLVLGLSLYLFLKKHPVLSALTITLALTLGTWSSLAFYNSFHEKAVVTTPQPIVRSGPSEDFPEIITLTEGSVVQVQEQDSGWMKIKFQLINSSNKAITGWLNKKYIQILP